jgi:hypothetical protein
MIQTGFETRVKIQDIVENQLPEFILEESPNASEFLKQYYISQEFQGGPVDIVENLDQYINLDKLTPEVISGETFITEEITEDSPVVIVDSTKGYPNKYGLLKIDDEIITYTGITTNTFTGCIRGFSGITTYQGDDINGDLIFVSTSRSSHKKQSKVVNLSSLFLKEFYKKIKYSLTPGLEDYDFVKTLNASTFIKEAKSFYQTKGTDESFRILFNILYGIDPKVVNLENFLIKPSSSEFLRREILLTEIISGENPLALVGQTVRQSSDPNVQASISSVEPLTTGGVTYYKISTFIGYGDNLVVTGNFNIPGKTKVVENVSPGSKVITVDSTVGFNNSGTLVCNSKTIRYKDKTVNQFLDCSEEEFESIQTPILSTSTIRSDEFIFGYENGNLNKKVELRITGVLNKFVSQNPIYSAVEDEKIYVKNLGERIFNPEVKNFKQIFANSWIYNTSSRYQISEISGATFTLFSDIDKSSLAVGDTIEILPRNRTNVVFSGAVVSSINAQTNQINLNDLSGFLPNPLLKYDLRRKLKKASSLIENIKYGNNQIVSDIQNVYNEMDEYFYVASNSLPSYPITNTRVEISLPEASGSAIQGFSATSLRYSIISFNSEVPFFTGDSVFYSFGGEAIPGLQEGRYYVEVLSDKNKIRLYSSISFVGTDNFVEFDPLPVGSGSHVFTLLEYANKVIGPKKVLKKFPSIPNIKTGSNIETKVGTTGMLVNGVEILNYKSRESIYYGPLVGFNIISGGNGYDVVNPPEIEITSSIGSTAFIQPVIRGFLNEVIVDPQDFDIKKIISLTITGGNNQGTTLEPIIQEQFREVLFDGRVVTSGGGIDPVQETITFLTGHNFFNGQEVIYDKNQNNPIGIGTFAGSNLDQDLYLSDGNIYFIETVNNKTVKLFNSLNDFSSGINTVGFSTANTQGIHKFRVAKGKKTLQSIKIKNVGSEFENRRLLVKPSSVDLTRSSISFVNHGFQHGDLISYETVGTPISGLSTSNNYFILKQDNDSFRLCDAGINGENRENFAKRNYVKFLTTGSGYQIFKYPDIKVTINAEYTDSVGIITATPVVKGSIIDAYLYESGSKYGSTILNFNKKPNLNVKLGRFAQIKPIVSNGRIVQCEIQNSGRDYTSPPDLIVKGSGIGAKLRAITENGSIVKVIIVNPGINYRSNDTSVKVSLRGSGAIIDLNVRKLTINNLKKYGNDAIISVDGISDLQYVWVGYSTNISKNVFNDTGTAHSPIIGWAYDGNPIYGPYGYSDPIDTDSAIKIIESGYTLNDSLVEDRPDGFDSGFFVEDYTFTENGDLDVYNGRFCKTPEFPNGIYAYFATLRQDESLNSLIPTFPYFVGNFYRSNIISENYILNQYFDFNGRNLRRNTFPYKVFDSFAGNDFLVESNELRSQFAIVESIERSNVSSIEVVEPGVDYKVNDIAVFDNEGTDGGGLGAYVSRINGKEIIKLEAEVDTYDNSVIIQKSQNEILVSTGSTHDIFDNDQIILSNLSRDIFSLVGPHKVTVPSGSCFVYENIPSNSIVGFVTDISVSEIPQSFDVDSIIGIGSELMRVLNIFPQNKILRVKRNLVGISHTIGDRISLAPDTFLITKTTPSFTSKRNNKVYFNPHQSVGVGSTGGLTNTISISRGNFSENISIPNQSIYLPNHPFKTNQLVRVKKTTSGNPILVSKTPTSSPFFILGVNNQEDLYVINKSKDFIGLTTDIETTSSTSGLYFLDNGSNNFDYSVENFYDQVTAKVQKIVAKATVKENHELLNDDNVILEVNPSQSVGIGTTIPLKLVYNNLFDKLLVNPIGFSSSNVNISSNIITISSHGFATGDKVFYESNDPIGGLPVGGYFVYRISDDSFKLSETLDGILNLTPDFINFSSVGGTVHKISLINPNIFVYGKNNLIFDTSDSSLVGYDLKIFYDQNFNNEFVSVGDTSSFSVEKFGTVGLTTDSSLKINYSDSIPNKLFYSLEKSGFISTSDTDARNPNQIIYKDSIYSGGYSVFGIGATTFNVNLNSPPEELYYDQSSTKLLKYTTNSLNAKGGVAKVRVEFGGANYKNLPIFKEFITESGRNAFISPKSENIGKVGTVRILDPGFEYSTDRTLKPEAYISPIINLKNVNEISKIEVLDGGKNYTSSPDLVLVNSSTRKSISGGLLRADLTSNTISEIEVIRSPKGLETVTHELFTVNNSNGISIEIVESSEFSGVVTCFLTTPVFGFTNAPFKTGDKVFVEGIEKVSNVPGDGFNSSDYGYKFFDIVSYLNTNPAILVYALPEGKSNPGIAKEFQNSYATVISKNDYPVFSVTQKFSEFLDNEKILVLSNNNFVEKDIIITDYKKESIKIFGTDSLNVGDIIQGKDSGSLAEVSNIIENKGYFEIDYKLRKDFGWLDDVGKLNQDYQVLPDNDYYQNLSYTVKSPILFEDLTTPVNSLLHTAGLKNFADVGITSTAKISIGSSVVIFTNVYNFITDERVDAIENFDLAIDINTSNDRSKFIQLRDTRLTDYIECKTNRVLSVDDFSSLFSNRENTTTDFLDIIVFNAKEDYTKALIQIIDPNTLEIESLEVFTFKDGNNKNIFTFQKQSLSDSPSSRGLGNIFGNVDQIDGLTTLRFTPFKPLTGDYDIKVIKTNFNSTVSGIGTRDLNSVKLVGINTFINPNSSDNNVITVNSSEISGLFVNIQITDTTSLEKNFVEIYLTHDGNNTFRSEYFIETDQQTSSFSGNFIGSFSSDIDGNGILYLNYNPKNSRSLIRADIIQFASPTLGISTYTFLSPKQNEFTARSARLFSNYTNSSGISTAFSLNRNLFSTVKSYIKVSIGQTSVLHQILLVHNQNEVFTTQYPYLTSNDNITGIGTFGGVFNGSDLNLLFFPDFDYLNGSLEIQSYNETIYTITDAFNRAADLNYGTITQSVLTTQYNALEGKRINKTSFEMNTNNNPIFTKYFDPEDSETLDPVTGVFTIRDHFFSTGEKLIYKPSSSFIGAAFTSVGIGSTLNSLDQIVDVLPSEVYAVKIDNDRFTISTRKDYSYLGIGVTFTSLGLGNRHKLEMDKKVEKCIIAVDGVIQSPPSFTPISQVLENNDGKIGIGDSYFALSGISSIVPNDVLKIDNEFMKVEVVGFGITNTGPILGFGTYPLVQVQRGIFGTEELEHQDFTEARVYKGTFNIVENSIYFISAPKGDSSSRKNESNLIDPRSTFSGRVFLKQDYDDNIIFDDVSSSFDGLSETYTLTVQGINTTGIETGSGILLINNIFQPPSTENNPRNNYGYSESVGVSSVVFTGITSSNGQLIKTEGDINQNQLPRGGIIVSLGSSDGVGYAPLVGASVTAIIGVGGSIKSVGISTLDVFGSGYRGNVSVAITEVGHTGMGASILASVGVGGTLSFSVLNGGSGYSNPTIVVRDPDYQYLPVVGVSRRGIGQTTETGIGLLLNIEVGSSESPLVPISNKNADASNLINANKQLIAEVAVGRMLNNFPGFAVPGGNEKCISDIIAVLEALSFNLRFGGNERVYDAAKLYINNSYLSGEEEESIFAFIEAKNLAIQVMRNEPIDDGGYSTIPQFFDNTIIGDISGDPGVYSPGDCADVATAIHTFVGIVTFSIRDNIIPTTRVAVTTSFFEVTDFEIARQGYGFKVGDIFTPVGLVTDGRLSDPIKQFTLTVLDVFNDDFSSWRFGQLDYIDSIGALQDGFRVRFPLFYRGDLLSFESNSSDADSERIDLNSVLLIFVNGVMQTPRKDYIFTGGTSFVFTTAPREEDNVSVFFYRGTRDQDSTIVSGITPTLKVGDDVVLKKNDNDFNLEGQSQRTIQRIATSDIIETNIYTGPGIDENRYRPLKWIKQKEDRLIFGESVGKSRISIESLVYPASKIIKDFSNSDNELFVDNSRFFRYEEDNSSTIITGLSGFITENDDKSIGKIIPIVSNNGTIEAFVIEDGGSGYSGDTIDIRVSSPPRIGIGIGTVAFATATITNGQISEPIVIENPGFGYNNETPPSAIVSSPQSKLEIISNINGIEGFSGIITGISTSLGVSGNPLALNFFLRVNELDFTGLNVGYPIFVYDTGVGNGIISIDNDDLSVVGVGTTYVDNIYYIHSISSLGNNAVVTTNVKSDSNISGILTSGSPNNPVGRFSWGRFYGFNRSSNPISIGVTGNIVDSQLSSFPNIQRRGFGIRNSGALEDRLI